MLLGLILIYFVGKAFYDLAARHNKSKWGYAILGVVSYYVGLILAGIVMAIASEFAVFSFYDYPDSVVGLMAFPIGVLSCWGTYKLIKRQWEKPEGVSSEEILDSDLMK